MVGRVTHHYNTIVTMKGTTSVAREAQRMSTIGINMVVQLTGSVVSHYNATVTANRIMVVARDTNTSTMGTNTVIQLTGRVTHH